MNPLLSVEDVHVTFTRQGIVARAVDGVSLDVAAGEVVALVGESGCGKTTLARTIMGLERPAAGIVNFDGHAIDRKRLRAYRRKVQLVFQDPTGALNPRHTIYEAVAEGHRVHRLAGDEVAAVAGALSRCGLRPPERFFTRYPHEVSGGQRQRVVIAGAMVLKPQLLIADEPVASLDASVRGEILKLLRDLVDGQGLGLLVITHDLGLAWNIADRIAVMYLGRIVEIGPCEQILERPQHPYTKALLSVVPESKQLEQQILVGETPDPRNIPRGCRFHPRCPLVQHGEAERAGILNECRTQDVALAPTAGNHQVACHAQVRR
jgi:peptide/nickel transport system ATP-binding protein